MVTMMGKWSYFAMFAILCLSFIAKESISYSEPIGILNISDEYLMAWNQGFTNETFFNRTTGLLQIANVLNRTKDVTYLMGYARKTGSTYIFSAINEPLINESFGTDFMTYYYASTSKNVSGVFLKRNYSQETFDNSVKITYTIISSRAILGNHYFASRLSNLDIGSDGIYETTEIVLKNGSSVWLWDNNGTLVYDDVVQLKIYGGVYSFFFSFPDNVTVQYNRSGNTTNGDFTILKNIGTLTAGVPYTVSYYWIDAGECILSCPRFCNPSMEGNITDVKYAQNSGNKFYCKWTSIGFGCGGGGCSLSTYCEISMVVGNYSKFTQIKNTSTDFTVRSINSTAANVSPVASTSYLWDFRASKIGNKEWNCHLGYLYLNYTITTSGWVSNWTTTGRDIKITLNNPENKTITSNNSVYFNCTSNTTIDNITMWVNTTLNYTSNNTNLSTNIYFTNSFYSNWTCKGCYSHNCDNTSAGINWLRVNITPSIIVIPSLSRYFFLFEKKTDKNNWLWWLI